MENPIIDLQTLESFKLVTEKKIDRKSLPPDLDKRLTMLKANVGRYNGMKVRTTQFFETIKKNDILIADEILTFLELPLPKRADYKEPVKEPVKPVEPVVVAPVVEPVKTPDPPKTPEPPVKSAQELKDEEEVRLAKEKKEKADAEEKEKKEKADAIEKEKNDKILAIDNAIKEKMQQYTTKDIISISDLQAIAGAGVNLGTELVVGTTRLRKVYKQSFYRLR